MELVKYLRQYEKSSYNMKLEMKALVMIIYVNRTVGFWIYVQCSAKFIHWFLIIPFWNEIIYATDSE
jgi:hypothetical protein